MKVLKRILATGMLLAAMPFYSYTQSILDRNISIEVSRQRLDNVLEIISNKGNFYFSYNSNIIKRDSLITLILNNKTVKQVLDILFDDSYEFKESGSYLIIRHKPVKVPAETTAAISDGKTYMISGYVVDDETGLRLSNASVYEKKLLASALTNENGYFKIKLKSKNKRVTLTVSKQFYEDTTIAIQPNYNQQLTITVSPVDENHSIVTVSPKDFYAPDSLKLRFQNDSVATEYLYVKKDSVKLEKTTVAMFLLSSKLKIQSLNLSKYFIDRPFQVSLTPGISTHGRLNSQTINNFSLNIFGGYSGGLNGAEIGGFFNLDKKNVQGFQVGGLFNLIGGSVTGVQITGISNTVINNMNGMQTAGIANYTKGKVKGMQLAGIYNHVSDSMQGMQVAGIINFANKKAKGLQVAGIGNFSRKQMNGTQIAGIFNYAKKLHGLQIGLVNVSDTSDGYSIGLLNLVNKGYHKISLSANETMNANLTVKTGNAKLYSMLMAGINIDKSSKIYSFGFGMGHDIILSNALSISTEASSQYLYLGSWSYTNLLNKFSLDANVKLNRFITLFAGPSFNVYYSNQAIAINDYKENIPSNNYGTFNFSNNVKGWIGWHAGVTFF